MYLTVSLSPPKTYSLYHSLMMKMKPILLVTLVSLVFGAIPLRGQRSEEEQLKMERKPKTGLFKKRNKR